MSSNANVRGTTPAPNTRTAMQKAALAMGAVFVLVGVLGFVPGVTQFDTFKVAEQEWMAMLLGVFMVSVLHNIVHLLFGVVVSPRRGTTVLRGPTCSQVAPSTWCCGSMAWSSTSASVNFVPVNTADNGLHLELGVVMIGLALVLGRRRDACVPTGPLIVGAARSQPRRTTVSREPPDL